MKLSDTYDLQEFLSKLRAHLLPRIQTVLQVEAATLPEYLRTEIPVRDPTKRDDCDLIFFKHDKLYLHKLARFNYTTYDVQRGQDNIHPGHSRSNVMVLANVDSDATSHHFWYAQVLGIYHANVIYTGSGMLDYCPRRMDFLWVRWYETMPATDDGWDTCELDCLRFPPLNREDSFGFLDPVDVLRECHIIPAFAKGPRHADGMGLSRCAKDGQDWKAYYVNR